MRVENGRSCTYTTAHLQWVQVGVGVRVRVVPGARARARSMNRVRSLRTRVRVRVRDLHVILQPLNAWLHLPLPHVLQAENGRPCTTKTAHLCIRLGSG